MGGLRGTVDPASAPARADGARPSRGKLRAHDASEVEAASAAARLGQAAVFRGLGGSPCLVYGLELKGEATGLLDDR